MGGTGGGAYTNEQFAAMSTEESCVWLRGVGKGRYEAQFCEAGIDGAALSSALMTGTLLADAVPGLPLLVAESIARAASKARVAPARDGNKRD
jgi:hypothetical protein